uniref:Alpha-ketoglutarate-dependent dioxygenase alkB homolog 3 n=2 Tax=Dromaius novaehollandiae TaxID=8790 RepID=A0A8C4JB90_DRONO
MYYIVVATFCSFLSISIWLCSETGCWAQMTFGLMRYSFLISFGNFRIFYQNLYRSGYSFLPFLYLWLCFLRIHLIPDFIDSEQADWIFEQLLQDIPWGQRTHVRQEVSFEEPRLTSWYGELPYTYSRLTMQPNPNWHPLLTMLKERIEEFTGYTFNSLLCNLYRNEKDSVDWHSDDEPSLGKNPVIASLSFGATRTFEMRKKPSPEENGDYTYVERLRIPLDHGTLLMMEGATQEDWQHRVPKEYHSRDARINLTFRIIYP